MGSYIFESKSSMDRATKFKTLLVSSFFSALILMCFFLKDGMLAYLLITLYAAAIIFGFLNTPYAYIITEDSLLIKKRIRATVLPLDEIVLVRNFKQSDRKGLYRKFAGEGIFGNIGIYSSNFHKTLHVFTSRDSNWVLIQTIQGKKFVISPNDLNLIECVNQRIGIQTKKQMESENDSHNHY